MKEYDALRQLQTLRSPRATNNYVAALTETRNNRQCH